MTCILAPVHLNEIADAAAGAGDFIPEWKTGDINPAKKLDYYGYEVA